MSSPAMLRGVLQNAVTWFGVVEVTAINGRWATALTFPISPSAA